jgi:predicted LPLAT superfamily acyltransferase
MASWKGQSRGNVLGYRIFFLTLRLFGVRGAYALLKFVGFYYFLFAREVQRVQRDYFSKVHGYSGAKAYWSVYRNIIQFGQTLIDKAVVMSGRMKMPFEIERDGEEHIANALGQDKGLLLISAHIGNWEVAGQLLNKFNTQVNLVMMDREREQLKRYLDQMLSARKLNIIPIGDDLSHLVAIKNAFADKQIVALHGDRFAEGQRTGIVEFFGKKARFPLGPFLLASKLKVPVLFVFCMKDSELVYHFYAHKPRLESTSAPDLLHDFVTQLEQKVSDYPYQWYNYYDFWGTENEAHNGNSSG